MTSPVAVPQLGVGEPEVRRRRIVWKALIVGVGVGALASGFRIALEHIDRFRHGLHDAADRPTALAVAIGLGAAAGALAVWMVRRLCPAAGGSGIPRLQTFLATGEGMDWKRLIPVKILGGVAACFSGLALGREGPTIQTGGAFGLGVAEMLKVPKGEGERRALVAAGAGAGLAAAFNAPLSGLVFVVEELQGAFTPVVFVASFLAAVAADIVARFVAGEAPVFTVDAGAPGLSCVPFAACAGVICGVLGGAFNFGLLRISAWLEGPSRRRPAVTGAVIGAVAGVVGWLRPEVAGPGGGLVVSALSGGIAAAAVPALFVTRYLLTTVSYGSGAAGGIFAPLLVLGALAGVGLAGVASVVAPAFAPTTTAAAVLGMGAILTGSVRAPLTSIVLMIELTGNYGFMLPVLVACFASYGMSEWIGSEPIYSSLRRRLTGASA